MFKGIPYSNKIIKRREEERNQFIHKQNLKNIRPITTNLEFSFETANQGKKKEMLQENRFTEIERENRMLLEKISTIMSKKSTFKNEKPNRANSMNSDKQRMNKSLNQAFRHKQLEDIEIQNAKLLKRIMDKKSDYETQKLKEEWKKQKEVIKNIANYPFIIRDKIYKGRKKSSTSHSSHQTNFAPTSLESDGIFTNPIQLVRIRKLGNENFLITLKYDGNKLQILGDNKSKKEIKVIEIPKDEALEFIHFECDGKIEMVFDCLRYSETDEALYLVGKGVEIEEVNTKREIERIEENEKEEKEEKEQEENEEKLKLNVKKEAEKEKEKEKGEIVEDEQKEEEKEKEIELKKENEENREKEEKAENEEIKDNEDKKEERERKTEEKNALEISNKEIQPKLQSESDERK